MEVFRAAVSLIVRSAVSSAQHAGQQSLLLLRQTAAVGGDAGEFARLREENRQLKAESNLLRSRLRQPSRKQRYTPMQRLQILWHVGYHGIPRKRVKEHFCVARSTLHPWLREAEKSVLGEKRPCQQNRRKTPA